MRGSLTRLLATVVLDDHPKDYVVETHSDGKTPAPPLPLELVDLFLEYLHPDDRDTSPALTPGWRRRTEDVSRREGRPDLLQRKRNLRACSLVCRAWHAITRAHLFRDMAFVISAPHKKKGQDAYKTFVDYDDFLKASPAVATCIRRLRLDFPDQYRRHGGGIHKLDPHILSLFLSRMPSLEELHLRNAHLTRHPIFRSTGPVEPYIRFSLKRLHIQHTEADSAPNHIPTSDVEIIMLLGLFARAETLHLTGLGIRGDYTRFSEAEGGPEELLVDRLVLERAHNGPTLFLAMRDAGTLRSLRQLEIGMVAELEESYDMVKNPAFLKAVSCTLEHLAIRIQRLTVPFGTNVIDISSFTTLASR